MKKLLSIAMVLLLISLSLVGCQNKESAAKGPVTVATMIDSEGAILGNMLILILEAEGFKTENKIALGTPDILRKALESKEVDLVIDYTGSGQYYGAVAEAEIWSDPQLGYEATRDFDKSANNIYWLSPSPANNTEMLAVKRDFAEKNSLKTMSDFSSYVNSGGKVKLIASSSFIANEMGLLGFQEAYGFELSADQLLVLSHGNTAEMLKALDEGTNDVNVSLVYGTDGSLKQMDMVILEDTMNIPPVYLPAPVIRGELVEKYPELEEMFKAVFDSLTLETLQELNAKVAYEGEDAKAVAYNYLKEKGFLK